MKDLSKYSKRVSSELELIKIANGLANVIQDQPSRLKVVGLIGDLGSGKSVFVRSVIQKLGYEGHIPSPTYTILEGYESVFSNIDIYHLDLYRLPNEQSSLRRSYRVIDEIGFYDLIKKENLIVFIEWIDLFQEIEKLADLIVKIDTIDDDCESRVLNFLIKNDCLELVLSKYIISD